MIGNIRLEDFLVASLGFLFGMYILAPALRSFMGLNQDNDND